MYDLDTIHKMNNESGKHLNGRAQTLTQIRRAAAKERADAQARIDNLHDNNWPEPRNE